MRHFARAFLVLLVPALVAQPALAKRDQGVAATQKVVQMLSDMLSKAKQMKKDEQVQYSAFTTWCTGEQASLSKSIKEQTETAANLDGQIGALTDEVKNLAAEIAQLQADILKYTADKKETIAQRAEEHKAFLAEQQDYAESVDALERAIAVLQKENYDRPAAAAALLQVVKDPQLPSNAKTVVSAFVGMMNDDSDDGLNYTAPEANAYEFQSGGIVSLLKKLLDDFRAKLGETQKEEMNSRHASEMVVQDLTDSIENAEKDVDEKTVMKERKAELAAANKKQLESTEASKAADEQTLADVKAECAEKKLSYEEKQQLRAEEIEAIGKAIEILSSPAVQEAAAQHLSLVQASKKGTSFVQFLGGNSGSTGNAGASSSEGIRRQVRDYLKRQGDKLHSRNLGLLAEKLAADPFAKVKKLIDDMITRLLNEAKADADHEGFCDKEMGQSRVTRNKLTEDIDTLSAAIAEGKATIAMLTQEISQLNADIAALASAMTEATNLRQAEKEKNKATVEDAEAASKAVAAATAVLKEFYAHASTATALVQVKRQPSIAGPKEVRMGSEEWKELANPELEGTVDWGHKAGMQTFGATYKGQQDEAGGVMALLEVIAADFATLISETEASEAAAQKAYEDYMAQASKASKEKAAQMDEEDRMAAESKLQTDIADLKGTQDQLLAADRYYQNLVPQCIDKGMTFEERTKARAAEIASLKEALEILGGAPAP